MSSNFKVKYSFCKVLWLQLMVMMVLAGYTAKKCMDEVLHFDPGTFGTHLLSFLILLLEIGVVADIFRGLTGGWFPANWLYKSMALFIGVLLYHGITTFTYVLYALTEKGSSELEAYVITEEDFKERVLLAEFEIAVNILSLAIIAGALEYGQLLQKSMTTKEESILKKVRGDLYWLCFHLGLSIVTCLLTLSGQALTEINEESRYEGYVRVVNSVINLVTSAKLLEHFLEKGFGPIIMDIQDDQQIMVSVVQVS